MGLNKVTKGSNMYDFIDATWNAVKGECFHDCSYCYMKRWGKLNKVRFDASELKTDLGKGNFIFVGSSCDMFARNIPSQWIYDTLKHCQNFDNQFMFQTKDVNGLLLFRNNIPKNSVICTTIETNRYYPEIMRNSPIVSERATGMEIVRSIISKRTYVTCEPLLQFDLNEMVELIKICNPMQCNVGFDSGNNYLPEPTKEETLSLISELQKFTKVNIKNNAYRILK